MPSDIERADWEELNQERVGYAYGEESWFLYDDPDDVNRRFTTRREAVSAAMGVPHEEPVKSLDIIEETGTGFSYVRWELWRQTKDEVERLQGIVNDFQAVVHDQAALVQVSACAWEYFRDEETPMETRDRQIQRDVLAEAFKNLHGE